MTGWVGDRAVTVICHDWRQPFADDDEVVSAVEQIVVGSQEDGRETIDGARQAAFHVRHWSDPADWREERRGPLRDVYPTV